MLQGMLDYRINVAIEYAIDTYHVKIMAAFARHLKGKVGRHWLALVVKSKKPSLQNPRTGRKGKSE